ncbi:hypothetical protein ACFFGH_16840 [Lysobacter korlensis]|uniref:Uncharacterized protein n=1 Tax=Lysobacter korlensis TaxID=553636 RepID=A0ABV6RRA6_9GAMM
MDRALYRHVRRRIRDRALIGDRRVAGRVAAPRTVNSIGGSATAATCAHSMSRRQAMHPDAIGCPKRCQQPGGLEDA